MNLFDLLEQEFWGHGWKTFTGISTLLFFLLILCFPQNTVLLIICLSALIAGVIFQSDFRPGIEAREFLHRADCLKRLMIVSYPHQLTVDLTVTARHFPSHKLSTSLSQKHHGPLVVGLYIPKTIGHQCQLEGICHVLDLDTGNMFEVDNWSILSPGHYLVALAGTGSCLTVT